MPQDFQQRLQDVTGRAFYFKSFLLVHPKPENDEVMTLQLVSIKTDIERETQSYFAKGSFDRGTLDRVSVADNASPAASPSRWENALSYLVMMWIRGKHGVICSQLSL